VSSFNQRLKSLRASSTPVTRNPKVRMRAAPPNAIARPTNTPGKTCIGSHISADRTLATPRGWSTLSWPINGFTIGVSAALDRHRRVFDDRDLVAEFSGKANGRNGVTHSQCGAKTRAGTACQSPPVAGRKRCRLHGGLSPGAPRGSRNGNYRRGDWTTEAIEERRWLRSLVRNFAKTEAGR
jgi:hypothetical protein